MELLQLNNDCLQHIFLELNLRDQIVLAGVHQRFENIAISLWKGLYKQVSLSFAEIDLSDTNFQYFLSIISKFFVVLRLKFLTKCKYKILSSFRCMHLIDFRFQEDSQKFLTDDDMIKFVEIFPNIQNFSPQGDFTGKYVNKMTSLRNLTLSHCKKLCKTHVLEICRDIALKSLNLNQIQVEEFGIILQPLFKSFNTLEKITMNEVDLNIDEFKVNRT